MRFNLFDKAAIFWACIGIFTYVLFEFISILFIQVVATFCLVVALILLFIAQSTARQEWMAYKRYENFKKLKKHLTDEYNGKSDSRTENEKSEDDADPE